MMQPYYGTPNLPFLLESTHLNNLFMGLLHSFITQSWPPKTKFTVEDIPDLTDKVVLITGGNTGIGYHTAKAILPRNAKVYLACRDPERGKKAIADLESATGKKAILLVLDLSSFESIKSAVEEFMAHESKLHILFNSAGVMTPPEDQVTKEGYDLTFGTNVIGHFYLTKLLLPALLAVSQAQDSDEKARVVNTSSFASELTNKLDYSAFEGRKLSTETMYAQSKLANVIFATELARRYGDQGIVSTSVNPGNLETEIQRNLNRFKFLTLKLLLLHPAEYGALTQLYAGTSVEGASFNGKYLAPWARVYPAAPASQEPTAGKELWEWLEAQITNH